MSAGGGAASKASSSGGFGEKFAEVKGGIDNIQAGMASILPCFPGVSSGKQFDMAIGLDFEPTILPPCPVFPVPHIGLVFDIFNAIMGAIADAMPAPSEDDGAMMTVAHFVVDMLKPSVKGHSLWICNAGTPIIHLPGILIHLIPLAKPFSSSELWMGSSTVLADGGPYSSQFHPTLSCNLVGFPSLPRKNKIPKIKYPLMLPTSILLTIFAGNGKTLVGGPPTIDLFQLMIKLGLKGLTKMRKKKVDSPDAPPARNPKAEASQPNSKCNGKGEPVDMATGKVFSSNTDFTLPGPLPLVWERHYYSNIEMNGPLGYNWHHNYNMGLYDMNNGYFTLRLSDGREVVLPKVHIGEVFYNRKEQLFIQQDGEGFFITDNNKLTYRFEGAANSEGYTMLSSITNTLGVSINFIYDFKGRLRRIIDSSKRVLHVENDALGHITRIFTKLKDREVTFIEYWYDAAGNLVKTLDVIGAEKHFEYEGHLLVKLTNQSGLSFYWEYEGKGDDAKCIHTWGDGGILEYWTTYEPGKTVTRDSLGYSSEFYYDDRLLIYKIIDENGGTTRQVWNSFQELELTINPEGGTVKYNHNQYGKITSIVNENEQNANFQYDDRLNLKCTTSYGGHSEVYFYDQQNRLIANRNLDGKAIEYEYEGIYLKKIKDQRKRFINFSYDAQHNVTALHYSNGLEEHWSYDALGYVNRYIDVRGNVTEYKNDDGGNIIYLKESDGNEHQFQYDSNYNIIEARDFNHRVQFEYGPMGVLTKRTQNNRSIQFNYDTELLLKSIANDGGELYKFGRDGLGSVVNEWSFDGLHRRYLRDMNGRVVKVLRPQERWTTYNYDGVGNIVQEEHNDGSMAAYKYNHDNLLVEAFNETSHIKLLRQQNGRLIKESQGRYEVLSKFDKNGNRINISSNLGADINLAYDENDLVSRMKAASPQHSPEERESWRVSFQRDNTGLELHRQLTGNVEVKTDRDRLGRVTRRSIGAQNVEQSRNRYDWGMGNKLNRIVNELNSSRALFDYDAFDNLVSATYENKAGVGETIYRVPDKIGNLFKTKDRSDRNYSKGGRLQEDDKYAYHYDGEGNIIFKEFKKNINIAAVVHTEWARENEIDFKRSGTGWVYEWAGNGMLKKVVNPGGRKIEFFYDPLGRREAKLVGEKVIRYVWDGNVLLHEWEYDGVYPPQQEIGDDGALTAPKEPIENIVTWVYEEGSFVPTAKILDNEQYSVVTDYLGTPTHAYNGAGEKVWERELDIYGAVLKESGDKGLIPQLYQGQYIDEETGLAYNRFRYYDNESGNYLSQDPIGLFGDNLTLYSYVYDVNTEVDVHGLATHMVGDYPMGPWGERVAAKYLERNGHSILGSVQNNSGHGFDLVTKTKDGNIHIIEVKTSGVRPAGKANMASWTNANINKITGNTNGRWGNKPKYQDDLMRTIRDARAKGKLKSKLIQINVGQRSIKMTCK